MPGKYEVPGYGVPSASSYEDGQDAGSQRWEDYKRVREGLPPIHARRRVTEADPTQIREALAEMGIRVAEPVPDIADVTPADLQRLRIDDPDAYNELRRAFANSVFSGHDARRGQGGSPFNRGVGG